MNTIITVVSSDGVIMRGPVETRSHAQLRITIDVLRAWAAKHSARVLLQTGYYWPAAAPTPRQPAEVRAACRAPSLRVLHGGNQCRRRVVPPTLRLVPKEPS